RMGPSGIAGPNPIVTTVGRAVTGRFLESQLNPQYSYMQVPAGESRVLFQEYSSKTVKPGDVYSMFADAQMSASLKVQVAVVNSDRNIISELPKMQVLPSNDRHIRGTFDKANRIIY